MRLLYTKPELKDLSQGSRIAFVRQFRLMSQNEVSDRLGLTGECKRKSMTRYEKGDRNPKEKRAKELANSIKENRLLNPLTVRKNIYMYTNTILINIIFDIIFKICYHMSY